MVHFVGAGPGAVDLITVRGMELLKEADLVIYAGSLVNPALLSYCKEGIMTYDSSLLTLEQVITIIKEFENSKPGEVSIVRLHTGDPSIYGAIREQMDELEKLGITYDVTPGVTAAFGAAASLGIEYTLPGVSQSFVITREEGRTKVPEKETIQSFAAHSCSMAVYLSTGLIEKLQENLLAGGYAEETPAAIVYKATWEDEKRIVATVGSLVEAAKELGVNKTAVILVGGAVSPVGDVERSKLYSPDFTTEYRRGSDD